MEVMGEFDNESPLYVSYCTRVSPEDFERQSLTYTQKCLQDLYAKMEQDPGICTTVVRKRKQLESEEAGLVPYLKAKFLSLINYDNALEMDVIEKEMEQLKHEMQRASNYASAAKRASQWSLERKSRNNNPLGRFNSTQIKTLDPVIPVMPKIFGPFTPQVERSTGSIMDPRQPWASTSSATQKRTVDLHPIITSTSACHSSFLGSRLKSNNFPRCPSNLSATSSFQMSGPSARTSSSPSSSMLSSTQGTGEDKTDKEKPGPSSYFRGP